MAAVKGQGDGDARGVGAGRREQPGSIDRFRFGLGWERSWLLVDGRVLTDRQVGEVKKELGRGADGAAGKAAVLVLS